MLKIKTESESKIVYEVQGKTITVIRENKFDNETITLFIESVLDVIKSEDLKVEL